tara:strand:+ start:682 stop:1308 length:627 start_codon:yes stop_codon:yes gene_type:complete
MSSSIPPNTTYSQDARALSKSADKVDNMSTGQQASKLEDDQKLEKAQASISLSNKQQLNAAIIESSLNYNTSIGDQPLSLVLKTALQGINEALNEMGVENTVEEAYESGVDFSPEAVAERIVSFSTQFLSSYREQHPEMDEEEALNAFVNIIGGGIDQGFDEAKEVLTSLKVLGEDISDTIDKTYALVQEGLQSFVESFNRTEEEPAQ